VIRVFGAAADHPAGVIVEFVDETGKIKTEHDIIDRAQIVKLRFHPTLEAA